MIRARRQSNFRSCLHSHLGRGGGGAMVQKSVFRQIIGGAARYSCLMGIESADRPILSPF